MGSTGQGSEEYLQVRERWLCSVEQEQKVEDPEQQPVEGFDLEMPGVLLELDVQQQLQPHVHLDLLLWTQADDGGWLWVWQWRRR